MVDATETSAMKMSDGTSSGGSPWRSITLRLVEPAGGPAVRQVTSAPGFRPSPVAQWACANGHERQRSAGASERPRGAPGRRVLLDELTFRLAPRRITDPLGPSGCGKTTLMRTLVGVQTIAAGQVTLLGLPAGHPKLRARIGYATQESAVYSDLTLIENLRYFGTVLGLRKRQLAEVITATVGELDLTGLEGRVVGTFSGGQLARVGLAVALLGNPDLLVLDGPTVGLDPVLRRDLWAMFHRLAAAGTALLVSSHVMDEAARCDYLLFMRDGRFLAEATPAEVLRRTGTTDLEAAFLSLAASPVIARLPLAARPGTRRRSAGP